MIALDTVFRTQAFAQLQAFSGFVVSGADAEGFLQGQLTNDVRGLGASRHQRTGYCTPKGRLLSVMLQWRISPESFGFLLPADLHASTVKRLRMYVLRAKAAFGPADTPLLAMGLWGGTVSPADPGQVIALDEDRGPWLLIDSPCPVMGPRAWLVGSANQLQASIGADRPIPERDPMAWSMGDVLCGRPWVWSATVEAFVPQMINLELVDGVSFTKGCYPGQEVVARSQYLGKLKRRTFRAEITSGDLPQTIAPDASGKPTTWQPDTLAGVDVWPEADAGEPCGKVVGAAPRINASGQIDTGASLLVECTLDAWASGGLHLGRPDGPLLHKAELPYAFPAAA